VWSPRVKVPSITTGAAVVVEPVVVVETPVASVVVETAVVVETSVEAVEVEVEVRVGSAVVMLMMVPSTHSVTAQLG
jgi:hypothetical protein